MTVEGAAGYADFPVWIGCVDFDPARPRPSPPNPDNRYNLQDSTITGRYNHYKRNYLGIVIEQRLYRMCYLLDYSYVYDNCNDSIVYVGCRGADCHFGRPTAILAGYRKIPSNR